MRFSVFLALFVATFAVCTSFTSAENAAASAVRRLKGSTVDDEARAVNFGHLAINKLKNIGKIKEGADKMKAGAAVSAKLTTKDEVKLTKMVAAAAKKDVPWSRTRQIIVAVVGAAIGSATLTTLYMTFLSNGGATD